MNDSHSRDENWVFLGDSLTEGVGSSRISYVNEFARSMRQWADKRPVHVLRLRKVSPDRVSRFVQFNLAGNLESDSQDQGSCRWLWNLACEGRMLDTDREWFPLVQTLRPRTVVVFRGGLESIVRPFPLISGAWPWWVPRNWRSYAAMDPRCYFSSTWWRRGKQVVIDRVKQRLRLRLLRAGAGSPLMDGDELIRRYEENLTRLIRLNTRVVVLGLLPPLPDCFPGSAERFGAINQRLAVLSGSIGVVFFPWDECLPQGQGRAELFYRDGFHPNQNGARVLGSALANFMARYE